MMFAFRLWKTAATCCLLAAFLFISISVASQEDSAYVAAKKDLLRDADPVVIKGESFKGMTGRPIANLRLFAWKQSGLLPIPFQIDERDPKGELVFPLGDKPNADDDSGLFDANDELVFMAMDAGDRIVPSVLPKGARQAAMIVLRDPKTGGRAYAYLLDFDRPPPLSPVDYIRWDARRKEVVSAICTIGYHNPRVPALLDHLTINKGNRAGKDLLDRFKMRVTASMLFGKPQITRTEEDIRIKFLAHIDGPVRVVQKLKFTLRMFMGVQSPSLIRINTSYVNSSDFPNVVTIPFNIDFLFTNVNLVSSLDFTEAVSPARFYDGHNPGGVDIDGTMSEAESAMDLTFGRWVAVAGDFGGLVSLFSMSENLAQMDIPNRLYYLDDAGIRDLPEDEPGQYGNMGWEIDQMNRLKKGLYSIFLTVYFTENYRIGDHQQFLDIEDVPLEAIVENPS